MQPHSDRGHAKRPPSGVARWGSCAASINMEENAPPEGANPYADWGTRCHEIAERYLLTGIWLEDAEPEQWEVAKVYTEYCLKLPGITAVEAEVSLGHFGLPDIYGTADFIVHRDKTLTVVDLKAGIGPVSAVNNGQLMIYALGAAGKDLLAYDTIKMVIVQPRCEPQIKEHTLTVDELLGWFKDYLIPAVEATKQDDPPFCPGEEQCRWCRAKGFCKAYADYISQLAVVEFKDFVPPKPTSLSDEQLAQIVEHGATIEKWLKAVRTYAKDYMSGGGLIPGFKMVTGRKGNRTWKDEEAARKFLIRKVGKEELYDYKIKSPAKIEALLKGSKHQAALQNYTENKPGSPTIVPESDKREAITSTAQLAFADFAQPASSGSTET